MLKNILKLKGTQQLSKNEQKNIKGSGYLNCAPGTFSTPCGCRGSKDACLIDKEPNKAE